MGCFLVLLGLAAAPAGIQMVFGKGHGITEQWDHGIMGLVDCGVWSWYKGVPPDFCVYVEADLS